MRKFEFEPRENCIEDSSERFGNYFEQNFNKMVPTAEKSSLWYLLGEEVKSAGLRGRRQ